jgi:N-acetylglucosaminyldiphosphoundecaprenol N-acetyl-beta-D-mannosaminyltransferase
MNNLLLVLTKNHKKKGPLYNTITFLNPYSYLIARKEIDTMRNIDCIMYDGFLLNFLMRFTGINTKRTSFDMTSLAPIVFHDASASGDDIYFIGSEEGVADKAATQFKYQFPSLKVRGTRHGFFTDRQERDDVIAGLVEEKPSIVIVGMGTPAQEKFLVDLKSAGWAGKGYTCGGFLHQTAHGGTQYYPEWMNRMNLRWLYRMIDEPKLIRRYFIDYPKFIFVFAYDLFLYWLRRKSQ